MQNIIIPSKRKLLNHGRETQSSSTRKIDIVAFRRKGLYRLGITVDSERFADKKQIQPVPKIASRVLLTKKVSSASGSTPRNEEKAWFRKHILALEKLRELPKNWDSYGAAPPNFTALYWSKTVFELLLRINFPPTKVTPSVENGVAISFIQAEKYADIECFNTGEILAVTSDRQGNPDVWKVEDNVEAIESALERIRVFIRN